MSQQESNLAETKAALAEMAKEAAELKQVVGGPITDVVADWLAAKYVMAAREKLNGHTSGPSWELLRAMVQDWTGLRRGDHSAARLQLDREELDLVRSNIAAQKEKEFPEWLERPDIQKKYFPDKKKGISAETIKMIEEELHLL